MRIEPSIILHPIPLMETIIAGESGEGLCFDEVCEIVIVPGGGFQAQSD